MKKVTLLLFILLQPFCSAQNLIVNGDFEQGNKFFSSEYVYNPVSGVQEGNYKVDKNSYNWWAIDTLSCFDHTTGKSNMMYVNGATSANKRIWYQTVNVGIHDTCTFSIWVVNLIKDNPAELNIYINNNLLKTIKQSNAVANEWKNYTFDWIATTDKATIAIIDKNTAAMGNDFGIDDLSFVDKYIIKPSSIYFPDTLANLGMENYKIPLKVKLYEKKISFVNLAYTAKFKFKADVFDLKGLTKGTILKDSLDNSNFRNITIFCDSVNINDTNKLLTLLIGTVLLGDRTTPLDITDFQWQSPKLKIAALIDGSLTTVSCPFFVWHLTYYNPIQLKIQPNPANDYLEINIEGDEQGYFTLSLYDLQGIKINEKTWQRDHRDHNANENFSMPLTNFSVGVYKVVLKTPSSVITKSLMIIK